MSNQGPQRVRRNVSPGTTKQGPLKATLPFTLRGSPVAVSDGPTKAKSSRRSPEYCRSSPERRSPGSPSTKVQEKLRYVSAKASSGSSPLIRRTASLDAIYLAGQWPRDSSLHTYCGRPLLNKCTQTPDDWDEYLEKKKSCAQLRSNSVGTTDQSVRHRMQRGKEIPPRQRFSPVTQLATLPPLQSSPQMQSQQQAPTPSSSSSSSSIVQTQGVQPNVASSSSSSSSRAIAIPNLNIPKQQHSQRMRNSVEGLNQEIEKLVLKGISGNEADPRVNDPTPDGHRAPIADLFRHTRHADTQTPLGGIKGSSILLDSQLSRESSSAGSSAPTSRCESVGSPTVGAPSLEENNGEEVSAINTNTDDGTAPTTINKTIEAATKSSKSSKSYLKSEQEPCFFEDSGDPSPENEAWLGTSPKINKFLAREPPDGCERVKIIEETNRKSQPVFANPTSYFPPEPSLNFVFKPSSSSAFYPLYKHYFEQQGPLVGDLALKSTTTAQIAASANVARK